MRAVVQRVSEAKVVVAGETVGEIDSGLCVLIGAGAGDDESDVRYLCSKLTGLRIFADQDGKMNLSVMDIGGGILAISQFTLFGDTRKGRRPAFGAALEPGRAEELYDLLVAQLGQAGVPRVAAGVFRADMKVHLVNDGPVTILIDSKKLF